MYAYRFIIIIALIFAFNTGVSHDAGAQDYYLKKESNPSFFSRLLGWGKKKEQPQPQKEQKKTSKKRSSSGPKTTLDAPKQLEIKPYAQDDSSAEFNMESFQEETFGKCTEKDKEKMETVNQMFEQFDAESEAFQEKGTPPTGYEYPKGDDIDEYDEEDLENAQPAGVHEFLSDEENSEQMIGLMMRCKDWKTVLEEKKERDKERAERQKKRKKNKDNKR